MTIMPMRHTLGRHFLLPFKGLRGRQVLEADKHGPNQGCSVLLGISGGKGYRQFLVLTAEVRRGSGMPLSFLQCTRPPAPKARSAETEEPCASPSSGFESFPPYQSPVSCGFIPISQKMKTRF